MWQATVRDAKFRAFPRKETNCTGSKTRDEKPCLDQSAHSRATGVPKASFLYVNQQEIVQIVHQQHPRRKYSLESPRKACLAKVRTVLLAEGEALQLYSGQTRSWPEPENPLRLGR